MTDKEYVQAVDEMNQQGGNEGAYGCEYGHLACALRPNGSCSAEALSRFGEKEYNEYWGVEDNEALESAAGSLK